MISFVRFVEFSIHFFSYGDNVPVVARPGALEVSPQAVVSVYTHPSPLPELPVDQTG